MKKNCFEFREVLAKCLKDHMNHWSSTVYVIYVRLFGVLVRDAILETMMDAIKWPSNLYMCICQVYIMNLPWLCGNNLQLEMCLNE